MALATPALKNGYVPLAPTNVDSDSRRAPGAPAGPVYPTGDEGPEGEKKPTWWVYLGEAKEVWEGNIGLLFVYGSTRMASFAMMDAAVRRLHNIEPPVSTLQPAAIRMASHQNRECVLWGRGVVLKQFWLSGNHVHMFATSVPDLFLGPKGVRSPLAFRGLAGFFALFGIYYALQFLSLSDATVITFLVPFCTAITGALFLGENYTRRQAVLNFGGVTRIGRPVFLFGDESYGPGPELGGGDAPVLSEKGTPTERLIAVGAGLMGVLGASGAYTSLRAIGRRTHPLHSIVSFPLLASSSPSRASLTHTPFVIPLFFTMGIFGFLAQVLSFYMPYFADLSLSVHTQMCMLTIIATIIERIFFKTIPSKFSLIRTLVIISSAICVVITEMTKERPQKAEINTISPRTIHEDSLEEGLLEQTRSEEESNTPVRK